MWIFFTVLAAIMQALRNALQSHLSKDVSTAGVTLARFLWATPIAAIYLLSLYLYQPTKLPDFSRAFYLYVAGASLVQIAATALMVMLFKLKNYSVGVGLAKSEAIIAAILGVCFFNTHLSVSGWIGVLIGAIAIFLMGGHQGVRGASPKVILLGIACGSGFALTSLWVRQASLILTLPFPYSAAWVLVFVIGIQTLTLLIYLLITHPESLKALISRPRLTFLTSATSCIGSIGWFSAMSLQSVPYVKTLGQIEVFFTLLIAVFWLKEKVQMKEVIALILIAIAAICVLC